MSKCVVCQSKHSHILFTRSDSRKMGRCDTCGLVQLVPMPSPEQIAHLYHEDFDHFTPYIKQLAVHHAYFKRIVSDVILANARIGIGTGKTKTDSRLRGNDKSRLRLLDIGCAMGVLLEEAKKKGFNVAGIDLSNDAVKYCKTHGLTAYTGTVYTVSSLKKASFDVISAFQIIEHERDPLKMMKRVYNLLKNDGLVILATPDYGGFWRKVMGKRWFGFTHPEHVILLDKISMKVLLEKSGFRDIEIHSDIARPFPLSFAITRAADYFPWAAFILKPAGKMLEYFKVINPINPWNDMIAFAKK